MPLILGLETSCDETAASVVMDGTRVLSSVVWSQHELHERYAGVVPEIASRAHLEAIMPVIDAALREAAPGSCGFADVDAIAVGNRPGLIGSLIVGVSAAKALAWSLGKPLIGVDHVEAHLWAASLREGGARRVEGGGCAPPSTLHSPLSTSPTYPALGLVISGGHTTLYHLAGPTKLHALGRTIDDAVGEAYDKAAVILDAGYPGGPALDKLAQQGDPDAVEPLPISLLDRDSLDFSFSGLKTALLYRVRGHPIGRGADAHFERDAGDLSEKQRADLAAAFQHAAIAAVVRKIERALDQLAERPDPAQSPTCVILGGGVSANSMLRRRMAELSQQRGLPVHVPAMCYCVDNAAMIAGLAHHYLIRNQTDTLDLPAIATTRH